MCWFILSEWVEFHESLGANYRPTQERTLVIYRVFIL